MNVQERLVECVEAWSLFESACPCTVSTETTTFHGLLVIDDGARSAEEFPFFMIIPCP